MSLLNEEVAIAITPETKSVAIENFGTQLIVGPNVLVTSPARTTVVSSAAQSAAVLNGGVNAPEYLKVQAAFSQLNAPATVKLGNQAATNVTTINDNGGTMTSGSISADWSLNGASQTAVTTSWGTSKAATLGAFASALQAAIRAAVGGDTTSTVVYTDGSHTIVITPKGTNIVTVAITLIVGSSDTAAITTITSGAADAYNTSLAAIQLQDDDWYQLTIASPALADQLLAAAFCQSSSSPKIFSYASSDTNIITVAPGSDSSLSGSVAARMNGLGYSRTAGFYSGTAGRDSSAQGGAAIATQAIDAAFFGLIAGYAPGTFNAAYKSPVGVTPDVLTVQQEQYSRGYYSDIGGVGQFNVGKEINTFEPLANQNIVRWGRMASGDWIDYIIFKDWLIASLQAAVYGVLVNSAKIPRDINGYAMVEAAMTGVFKSAQSNGAIAPYAQDENKVQIGGYVINMPALSAASDSDKAGRVLNAISWECWYSGAVNSIHMTGSIS